MAIDIRGSAATASVADFAPSVVRQIALRGVPVSDNANASADATGRTTSATHRTPFTIQTACTDLRFFWHGWLNNGTTNSPNYADADSSAAAVIKAGVEIGGTIYRLTFGGSQTGTVDGGGFITSDPLPLEIAAGTTIYVRTFVSSGTWHYTHYALLSSGSGGTTATTDLTAPGSGAIADSSFSAQFAPCLITGRPTSTSSSAGKAVLIAGDSIAAGYGDAPGTNAWQGRNQTSTRLGGGGFIARALYGVCGHVMIAEPGESVSNFITNAGHFRRMTFAANCTTMVCNYGRNDITGGASLATVQANLITAWGLATQRGLKVVQTTITPRTTSTDGWQTTGNQSIPSAPQETVRVSLNQWLRAGAPMSGGAAVAIGTGGALLAGQSGHPLRGVWDAASAVESSTDSGLWKAWANTRTVTDAAISSGGNSLNSATITYTTPADYGRLVAVAGAGTAGAVFYSMIQAVTSGSSASTSSNASTTVSGASATIGDGPTLDGLHPTPYAAALMAAACDTTLIT